MNEIDNLSEEEAKEILKTLTDKAILTQDVLDALKKGILTEERKTAVTLVHSLFCTRIHMADECSWYNEDQLEDAWVRPIHVQWNNWLTAFMKEHGIKSIGGPTGVVDRMKSLMEIGNLVIERSTPIAMVIQFLSAADSRKNKE
jgi:hypothetical protein